jgi:hypothetical protein
VSFFKDIVGSVVQIGGAIVGFTLGGPAGFAVAFGSALAGTKLNERAAASQLRKMRDQGERFNVRNNVEPVPIIYGNIQQAPGAIVFMVTHGDPNLPTVVDSTEYLSMVIVWSEGQIASVDGYYINDIWYQDARLSGLMSEGTYYGSDTATADPGLITICSSPANPSLAGKWTVDHRLQGLAYTRITLKYSPGAYGADGIPTITAKIQGKVCYDPRSGLTGATRNPILHALDYLRNTRYGMAIPDAEIDFTSFSTAAAYCDEKVIGLANRDARWQNDCIIDPTEDPQEVLAQILSSCRGAVVRSSGTYKALVDRDQWPGFVLHEDNLTGPWSLQMDQLGMRVNRVRARFINIAKDSQPDFVIVDDAAYRVTDGDELLEREIDLSGVTNDGQATDLATWELRASRYSLIVEVTGLLETMVCEVGDLVELTHSVPGWTSKLFRVIGVTLMPNDEVKLRLKEYNATVYSAQTANADIPPGTSLPNPMDVAAPTGLTLTATRATQQAGGYLYGIDAAWSISAAAYIVGYHLEWQPTGAANWVAAAIARNDLTQYAIRGLEDVTNYTVRVRAYSSIGAVSAWTTATVTTLSDGSIEVPPEQELIVDPGMTDESMWNIVGGQWLDGGGPDGGGAIRLTDYLSYANNSRTRVPFTRCWTITATDNEFQIWLTVRRRVAPTPAYISVSASINSSSTAMTESTGLINLSSIPQNEWRTIGPYTIGPFSDPFGNDGNIHRINFAIQNQGDAIGTPRVVEVADIRILRVV